MSQTATAKTALGNIFGVVGTTTGAVSTAIGVGVDGLMMLDRFVAKHAEQQKLQYVVDAGLFEVNLIRDAAAEQAKREDEITKFCAESASHREAYDRNLTFFSKLLEDSRAAK